MRNSGVCFRRFACLLGILELFFLSSCVSHLENAKLHYLKAQEQDRIYRREAAVARFKSALEEARREVARRPSAQAYMLKGMAEMSLEMWEEAERSFLSAFSYGFEKAEDWARWVSLIGLALSLEENGLMDAAFRMYGHLVRTSRLRPVTVLAAQKYTERTLDEALKVTGKERERRLDAVVRVLDGLVRNDMSCGYYHYLLSQILSHKEDYRQSYEEAVVARELGLPSEEILRDNDLQIVFCVRKLRGTLPEEEWTAFQESHRRWMKKWRWPGPETPAWKKDSDASHDSMG